MSSRLIRASSGGIWGLITGIITDQTDLINYIATHSGILNLDGGVANSVYLVSQDIDGGGA